MTKKVVFKYLLNANVNVIPAGRIMLVDWQSGRRYPTVWAEHELPLTGETMRLEVRATGREYEHSDLDHHVGSAVCGPFVWHVFQDLPHVFEVTR